MGLFLRAGFWCHHGDPDFSPGVNQKNNGGMGILVPTDLITSIGIHSRGSAPLSCLFGKEKGAAEKVWKAGRFPYKFLVFGRNVSQRKRKQGAKF
jgi:hypothetical protein